MRYGIPLVFLTGVLSGGVLVWGLRPAAAPSSQKTKSGPSFSPSVGKAANPAHAASFAAHVAALGENVRPGEVNAALITELRALLKDPFAARRSRRWMTLLESMRPEDASAIRDLFTEGDAKGLALPAEWNAFWSRWAEVDGPGAMGFLSTLSRQDSPPDWLEGSIRLALTSWAAVNPAAAVDYVKSIEDPDVSRHFLMQITGGIAVTDLEGATGLALSLGSEKALLSPVMEQLSTQAVQSRGPSGLMEWFNHLPDGSARDAAFEHVVWRSLKAEPQAAKALIDANPQTPWNAGKILNNVISALSPSDPVETIRWAGALPFSQVENFAGVHIGVEEWMKTTPAPDPSALSRFVDQPWYDSAAAAVADRLKAEGNQGADAWIATIKDENLRLQKMNE